MKNSQRPCHLIREDIAWGRKLRQEDKKHVFSCIACSEIASQFTELDSLVREAIETKIPLGFADRVMAKIWKEEPKNDNLIYRWFPLLEKVLYSKAVQWSFVGIGSVFGLFKIFRFLSGAFI
jgi:hypothetical protein